MSELDKLLDEYFEKFDERFPLAMVQMPDDYIIKFVKQCIKDGKPYEPEYEDGVYY